MAKPAGLASTIRGKNAGVNEITFDIIFPDAPSYRRVLASGAIMKDNVAELPRIPVSRISTSPLSISPMRSNSRFTVCARAAAPETGIFSAASSMVRC
jgi:hypothetical protein